MKVIGAGFGRTGTMSPILSGLKKMLETGEPLELPPM
jgi:hypothetical protein